jgi:hypothetical protein
MRPHHPAFFPGIVSEIPKAQAVEKVVKVDFEQDGGF